MLHGVRRCSFTTTSASGSPPIPIVRWIFGPHTAHLSLSLSLSMYIEYHAVYAVCTTYAYISRHECVAALEHTNRLSRIFEIDAMYCSRYILYIEWVLVRSIFSEPIELLNSIFFISLCHFISIQFDLIDFPFFSIVAPSRFQYIRRNERQNETNSAGWKSSIIFLCSYRTKEIKKLKSKTASLIYDWNKDYAQQKSTQINFNCTLALTMYLVGKRTWLTALRHLMHVHMHLYQYHHLCLKIHPSIYIERMRMRIITHGNSFVRCHWHA